MKKSFVLISLTILLASIIIVSCKKETNTAETTISSNATYKDGMIVLGKKINDPYSIENMRQAYANIAESNLKSGLTPNRIYLRFLPKDEDELALLKSDTTLMFYDFPLDYEIDAQGTYYHDPSLPQNAITWQYVVVPVDYVIPNIRHEILYEVFIPVHEDESMLKSSDIDFYNQLEEEAFKITGNLPEPSEENQLKGLLPSKWTPKGRITVQDDVKGTIGMPQVSVHGRWSTHTESCLTDNNGYFTLPQFRYEVNYSIKWERRDFDIREGNWGQVWYNGPKQKGDWNLHITKGGMSWVYAHIHRGAWTYYYNNTFGIKSPPTDGKILKQRIHIGAINKSGRARYLDFNKFWLSPQIKIFAKYDNGSWRESERIFSITVHELAHASHWEIGYTYGQFLVDLIFSEPALPESWAQGVEAVIASHVYGQGLSWKWNQQDEKLSEITGGYTPLVWDLIDNVNQRTLYGTGYPIDNVSGYTLPQLEKALYGVKTWNAWRDAIRNMYVNPTEGYLNELFANYKK